PGAIVAANSYNVDGVSGATITSTAIRDAVKMALESAGFDPEAYVAAAPAEEPAEEAAAEAEDLVYDVDVVVVGAGGAGMTAAITASDAGKNVLVLESQGMVGGNSVRSTGGMNAGPTEWQQANEFGESAGVESTLAKVANYPDNERIQELGAIVAEQWAAYQENPEGYFDSEVLFQLDTLIGGGGMNDPALVKKLVESSESAIEFLGQLDPEVILHNVAQFGGASVKRIHRPVDEEGKTLSVGAYVVPLLQQNLESRGIELLLNTTAKEILMDSGKAVGVVAENADGVKVTVNAESVIIASGGFGANNEMIASIRPELDGFITTNAPGIQGQGIQMAQAVGADTVDLEQIQLHPTVHVEGSSAVLITEGLRGDGAILVNQEGERFFDEVSTRDKVSAAEFEQTGGYAWLIVDSRMSDASNVIQGYINKGYAETGETYEALAEAIGAPAEAFAATMEKWNACVEAKEDADFGRVSFANPLDQAPYYAIKVQPGIHHTMGGIKINDQAQVISTDGEVIPGLFAAGEVTGGVHGNNRLGGNAVADFVIFGRIAGNSAAGVEVAAPAEEEAPAEEAAPAAEAEEPAEAKAEEPAEAEAAAAGIYVPGTYTAEAVGMGKVIVNVTVDENAITAVEIDGSQETPEIGGAAIETLQQQVMDAQGAEIDGVSGASMTTNAVKMAVEAALAQAASADEALPAAA
ncbi:MAG: flavocytochrome c, partial [Oscillospiraceae bacterium]|nr:flavocytochrome c [Oscillospiraceae bacterium]